MPETPRSPAFALRPSTRGDVAAFFEHQLDPEANRMAAFTAPDPTDRKAFEARWTRLLADPTVVARTVWVDGAVAGHVVRFERDGVPEVTYWIDRCHWGRGLATRALRAFLDEVSHRPVHARVAADHVASRRVLEKCGFVEIARERGFAQARGRVIEERILALAPAGSPGTE